MFIYVWDTKTRDVLLREGFRLMNDYSDGKWIFLMEDKREWLFSIPDVVDFIVSDVLTF